MAKRQVERTVQTRLGKLAVDMDRVIHFPRGIIGFEECKKFTLLQLRDDSPFLILQSMTKPDLGLMVADPYKVKIGSAEQKILQVDDIHEIAVLVTVTIPPGKPEETSLNLMGPIIVNSKSRVGLQVPQVDAQHPARFAVGQKTQGDADAPPQGRTSGEVAGVVADGAGASAK